MEGLIELWLAHAELAERVVALPWVVDGVDESTLGALQALLGMARVDKDLAESVLKFMWVGDDVTEVEGEVLDALGEVASYDIELAKEVAGLPWLVDGLTQGKSAVVSAFASVGFGEVDLLDSVVALDWVDEEIEADEIAAVRHLFSLAAKDAELGDVLLRTVWFREGPGETESEALVSLDFVASSSVDLARHLSGLSWFADDVSEEESEFIDTIAALATRDFELTERLIALPWLVDDVTEAESLVVEAFESVGFEAVDVANWAVGLPWLVDGVSQNERAALYSALRLRIVDVGLSEGVAGMSWLADGVTVTEKDMLGRIESLAKIDPEMALAAAMLPWFVDGLSADEGNVMNFLSTIAEAEVRETGGDEEMEAEAATLLMTRPWLADGVVQSEAAVIHAIRNMAERDVGLARRVAALPWLVEDATGYDWFVATILDKMSGRDVDLANAVATLPWFTYDVTGGEGEAVRQLGEIASRDVELAKELATLSWFVDGVNEYEANTLAALGDLAIGGLELVKEVALLPWLNVGATEAERTVSSVLLGIAARDVELAKEVAALPWLADGITEVELNALLELSYYMYSDSGAGREIVASPWFAGGVTEDEGALRSALMEVASRDLEFANEIAALPWITDGVTKLEISAIYSLDGLAYVDEELVRQVLSWPRYQAGVQRDLDFFLLWGLGRADSDLLDTLTARTWFSDGLTDEEAALIVTLAGQNPSLYKALLIDSHLYHETISLPLAGDVNVWLVQDSSPVLNQESLRQIESAAQIAEEFFGAPFPTTDIIVLLVTEGRAEYGHLVRHLGSHMSVITHRGRLYGVPHEAAHYYLTSNFSGHPWFTEGGANFIEAFFNHERGDQNISSRETVVSKEVQSYCKDSGVENIRHNMYLLDRGQVSYFQCNYRQGEYLLLNLLKIMGKNAMSSALNELYESSGGHVPELRFSTPPTVEEIYEAFLKHAPSQQDRIVELFQVLHGGDFAFPEVDRMDGEADEAGNAEPVEIGDVATGSLDYIFDFDFFKIETEEGQIYRIRVEHETLGHTSITLFGPDGLSELRNGWQGRLRGPDGPMIQWKAPSSETYFFAIQNFGGKSGEYSFTITPAEEAPEDDHGNGIESATRIGRFKDIHGTIDDTFDEDFFRFNAHEGRVYHIFMSSQQTTDLCSQMYRADGSRSSEWYNRCDHGDLWQGGSVHGIRWVAPETGDFYLAISGFMESLGDYKFEIILALDPGNPN